MTNPIPHLIGTGELQRNAAAVIQKISQSDQESFVVTHNNPQAVMMSLKRYQELKALEDLEFIPHRKNSPKKIRESFEETGLYEKKFLDDLEQGLRRSSLLRSRRKNH